MSVKTMERLCLRAKVYSVHRSDVGTLAYLYLSKTGSVKIRLMVFHAPPDRKIY